jgi:hypothetical protein
VPPTGRLSRRAANAVLSIPGGPETTTTRGTPEAASASCASQQCSSTSRRTNASAMGSVITPVASCFGTGSPEATRRRLSGGRSP